MNGLQDNSGKCSQGVDEVAIKIVNELFSIQSTYLSKDCGIPSLIRIVSVPITSTLLMLLLMCQPAQQLQAHVLVLVLISGKQLLLWLTNATSRSRECHLQS